MKEYGEFMSFRQNSEHVNFGRNPVLLGDRIKSKSTKGSFGARHTQNSGKTLKLTLFDYLNKKQLGINLEQKLKYVIGNLKKY